MMTEGSDQQYQQQQLEQLKLETSSSASQVSTSDNASEQPLTEQGIPENIVQKIRSCIDAGKLSSTDIDSRVSEQLRSFPDDSTSVDSVFDEFNNSDLTGVVNKSAFLCNLIKQWKLRNPQQQKSTSHASSSEQGFGDLLDNSSGKRKPGPDEAKMKQIFDRTGYKIEITAGQRKYGGPPPDGPERPAPNSEVFVGKLPREIFEDELIPLCEESGKIWDLRLMIDPASGFNKGYCFVTYCDHADSTRAAERLNGYAIRPGKIIKANGSVANTRLFIGNIPKTKSKEEIAEELGKVVEGVANVIVYMPADEADKKRNRGFCFVDFDTHKNASVAKRKLTSGRVRVFNRDIAVDWADPDEEPDDTTMSQVKVLYVRNLTSEVTENDVKDLFLPYGNIERVRKVRDYAFVHFDKREDALNAMRALNGKTLGRNAMEISLAKPLSDKRKQAQMKREQRKQFDPSSDFQTEMHSGPPPATFRNPPQRGGSAHRPTESYHQDSFGAFGGGAPRGGNPRGGPSNRGFRGGGTGGVGGRGGRGGGGGDRGGYSGNRNRDDHFNQNTRGSYHNNNNNNNNSHHQNNNYRGGYSGPPPPSRNNSNDYQNQGNAVSGRYQNSGPNTQNPFGAFGGPTQNNSNNNNVPFNRPPNQMGMGPNNFGMNSMPSNQQYGGIKRPPNQMNDGSVSKRARPDTGSWGSMNADGSTNPNYQHQHQHQHQHQGSQQPHNGGNWYQDQGYSSSQQANYSWN